MSLLSLSSTLFPYTTLFRSRVSLSEVVVDVETGEHRGDAPARLVHAQQFGHGVAEGLVTVAGAAERDCRHGVVHHPGADRIDRKSTRLNSSHTVISYAVFCL